MKYFTKFLPTEGQISENDIVMCTNGVCCVYGKTSRHNLSVINMETLSYIKDPRKAELFLCTYDIVEGDTVKNDRHDHTELVTNLEEFLRTESKNSKSYRTIGIISSSAIWLKNGDKVEESDWILSGWYDDGNYSDIQEYIKTQPWTSNDIVKGKEVELLKNPGKWTNFFIKVKCSQCGTFH